MIIKGIIDEDFINYKIPALYIAFPYCSFKCDKENGNALCQNSALSLEKNIEINKEELCERYINNGITRAIICAGLEPIDSMVDLVSFIDTLRRVYKNNDTVVIYTGYTEQELENGEFGNYDSIEVNKSLYQNLIAYSNIIIKFGRFIPNEQKHLDDVLGVFLASNNQYARAFNYENKD